MAGGILRFCCYFVPSSHRCHPSEGAQVCTVSGLFRPRENLCLYGSLNTNTMPRPTRNEANINAPVVHFPSFRWFRRIANEMDDPRVPYKQSAEFSNTRRTGNHFNRSCTFATVYCVSCDCLGRSIKYLTVLEILTQICRFEQGSGSFYLRWKMWRFTKFEG